MTVSLTLLPSPRKPRTRRIFAFQVVGGYTRPEAHLPQEVGFLDSPGLPVLLRLKEAEPPVVHYATDRRGGRWRDLYQVQLPLPGRLEGLDSG